jgi:DUF4097 and DUF4098 domain-containing protein YvlB
MKKLALIPAIALIGALAIATPAAAREQKETERIDKTASIRAGGQLRIKNFSGKVTITGSARGDVAIHAVRRATRDRLDHIKLELRETANGVSIEANKKDDNWNEKNENVVDTELDIQVPQDVKLNIDVFSSDIHVTGVNGEQDLHTFSGTINVSDALGSIDAETFSGDIEVKLAQGAGGRVEFDSFSGSLDASGGMTTRSASRRRISGNIGSGGSADYNFKTFSGDVIIR